MPIYRYRAYNQRQQLVRGLVEGTNESAVAELLLERMLTVVAIDEANGDSFRFPLLFSKRVKRRSIVVFSRQLSVMIAATVPIVQAMRLLTNQTDDRVFKSVLAEMTNDIDGGMKMSTAFAKHSDVFSDFFVAMLRSGETSGRLEKVLNYLASQMEKDYELLSRIRGAMVYPIFIIFTMLAVTIVMLVLVIPQMTSILTESGAELPFLTLVLIRVSDFMKVFWWLIVLVLIGLFFGLRVAIRLPIVRLWWDTTKLKLPIFGNLVTKLTISRFANSLSTLIKGGVPISKALSITGDVVTNRSMKDLINRTVKQVEDGNSITTEFAKSDLMPAMVPQMLSVGERTGRMDEVLDKVGEFYAREVDVMVGSLTSLIEPMIMVILGIGAGFIVSAIMLPMFQLANSIK